MIFLYKIIGRFLPISSPGSNSSPQTFNSSPGEEFLPGWEPLAYKLFAKMLKQEYNALFRRYYFDMGNSTQFCILTPLKNPKSC